MLSLPAGEPQQPQHIQHCQRQHQPPFHVAMRLPLVTMIYERWWRPGLGKLLKGRGGPSMADEYALASELLELAPGKVVIDIG